MQFITFLSSAIQRLDYIEFLTIYLLHNEKEKLPFPSQDTLVLMSQFWYDFFQTYRLNTNDAFLEELTIYSLDLLKLCKSHNLPLNPASFLSLIKNKVNKEVEKGGKRVVGSENNVISEISMSYDRFQNKKKRIPSNLVKLKAMLVKAIKQDNHENFLLIYLSYSRFEQALCLPTSSIKPEIYKMWYRVFKDELKFPCSQLFLKKLSVYWFGLVHRYGIPVSKMDQYKLYTNLLEQPTNKKLTKVKRSRKGFFNKLFDL